MKTCVLKQRIIEEEFDIIYPKSISKGDVYLNELLYNTYSGGVDFIEFVNVTDKYLQLKNMHLFLIIFHYFSFFLIIVFSQSV